MPRRGLRGWLSWRVPPWAAPWEPLPGKTWRLDRVQLGLRRASQIAVGMALIVAACMLLWGKELLSLFINDQPELVDQVLTVAYRYLAVMSLGLFMLYLLFVYRSTLQGLGDTVTPMISGVVELVMRIGNALLLPLLIRITPSLVVVRDALIEKGNRAPTYGQRQKDHHRNNSGQHKEINSHHRRYAHHPAP